MVLTLIILIKRKISSPYESCLKLCLFLPLVSYFRVFRELIGLGASFVDVYVFIESCLVKDASLLTFAFATLLTFLLLSPCTVKEVRAEAEAVC